MTRARWYDVPKRCGTCDAYLQQVQQGGEAVQRCPWARRTADITMVAGALLWFCDRPYGRRNPHM